MNTDSLANVFRAHLNERGLGLISSGDIILDTISEQFALRELAEVALDVVRFAPGEVALDVVRFAPEEDITQVIPFAVLEELVAAARQL